MIRSVTHYDTEDRLRKALLTAAPSAAGATDGNTSNDGGGACSVCSYSDVDDNDDDGNFTDTELPLNQPLDWVLVNYDPDTTEHQSVKEELHRLQVLKSYWILDSEHCEDFDRLTRLAARYFQTSVAMIGLMDLGREWLLSEVGCEEKREIPRQVSFGNHALLNKHNLLVVQDASTDPRFEAFPDVVGPPSWKFYAGVPLVAPEGYKIGTFCIADSKPRPEGLSDEDKVMLRDWAALAIRQIIKRKSNMVWKQQQQSACSQQMIAYTSHDLMTPLTGVQLSLSILKDCDSFKARCTPYQHLLLKQAADCSDFMVRIGQAAMCTLGNGDDNPQTFLKQGQTKMTSLVENLVMVMEPNPKKVPLIVTLDDSVPEYVACDDLVLLRSAINLISNGLRRTQTGCVHLRISAKMNKRINRTSSYSCLSASCLNAAGDLPGTEGAAAAAVETVESCAASGVATETTTNHPLYDLFFECTDTGPDIPTSDYAHLFHAPPPAPEGATAGSPRKGGLGLLSVATLIHSLDGDFGFWPPRRRDKNGAKVTPRQQQKDGCSTFWFRVPAIAGLQEPFYHDEDAESAEENPWQFMADTARKSNTDIQCTQEDHPVVLMATSAADYRSMSNEEEAVPTSSMATDASPSAHALKREFPMDVTITSSNQDTAATSQADCKLPATNIHGGKLPAAGASTGRISLPAAIYATTPGANPHKRPKLLDPLPQQDSAAAAPVCLLATDTPTQYSNEALTRLEQCGWKVVVVHEGRDALRLLKMRHWNVVLFDDDICGTTPADGKNNDRSGCHGLVQEFRTWEQRNRTGYRRQDNLYMVCTRQHAIPSALDPRSVVLPPTGFNGTLGKPVQWKELKHFLMGNEGQELPLPPN